jgi:hypothetical protein
MEMLRQKLFFVDYRMINSSNTYVMVLLTFTQTVDPPLSHPS